MKNSRSYFYVKYTVQRRGGGMFVAYLYAKFSVPRIAS